jgi:hypothetical protein
MHVPAWMLCSFEPRRPQHSLQQQQQQQQQQAAREHPAPADALTQPPVSKELKPPHAGLVTVAAACLGCCHPNSGDTTSAQPHAPRPQVASTSAVGLSSAPQRQLTRCTHSRSPTQPTAALAASVCRPAQAHPHTHSTQEVCWVRQHANKSTNASTRPSAR